MDPNEKKKNSQLKEETDALWDVPEDDEDDEDETSDDDRHNKDERD